MTGSGSCAKCGGFIGEPGKVYGYAGKWCHCKWQESPATIQYVPPGHPKCECHQCTWLRASQMERSMIEQPKIVIKAGHPFDKCVCGHPKGDHIYEEGACRPGFVCESKCESYRPNPTVTLEEK